MAKSGVPDWFGSDAPQPPEPPRHSGGPRGAIVALAAVSVAGLAATVWIATANAPAPASNDSPTETAGAAADPNRDRMLDEMSKAAGNPAQEPDPSDLPSIDEIIASAELPSEDAEDTEVAPRSSNSVREVVQSLTPKTRACYQQELRRDPTAAGKVVVTFTIDPAGRVSKTQHSTTGALPKRIGVCIEGVLQQAEFGVASEPTTVKLPFVFGK